MRGTPRASGFRMPAEWEPHEATWIAWPHNREDWPGRFAPIPWVYAEIVRKLARVERVRILIKDRPAEDAARRILRKAGVNLDAVEFFHAPTDRSWTRDYCPLFVKSRAGEVALTNWRFNAWAKYDDWQRDAAIPAALAAALKLRAWEPGLVLEGGSIDVNGRGLLLTTEECLLSPVQARNPQLTRREIETALRDYLGARQIIWLHNGITGDDTHGHVDDLARFVNANTVVIASEPDRTDPNYEPLRENLAILRQLPLRVIKLPCPRLWYSMAGAVDAHDVRKTGWNLAPGKLRKLIGPEADGCKVDHVVAGVARHRDGGQKLLHYLVLFAVQRLFFCSRPLSARDCS